jgi:chromate transporter
MTPPARPVPLLSLYWLFFLVGMTSFGGGLTAWFHREVVLIRKWMTSDEFFSGYSLAQILPGVNSTNMAVYIGQHLRGAVGAMVSLAALLTAPFVIVIAAATGYNTLLGIPGLTAAMAGVATAAAGMIMRMGLTSAQGSLRHLPSVLVLAATVTAVGILRWPLVPVMLVLAPVSIAAAWYRKPAQASAEAAKSAAKEGT